MSQKFIYIAGIILTIIVGTILFWYVIRDYRAESAEVVEQVEEPIAPEPEPVPIVNWHAVMVELNDNPPTPIFEPYQTEKTIGQADLNKLEKIKDYLKNIPDGSLLVVGHTDISGARALNMRLSRERAEFVASFLVQNGIPADKITTSFKGPDEPAHDNSTAEGRAKNRRAVVLIK